MLRMMDGLFFERRDLVRWVTVFVLVNLLLLMKFESVVGGLLCQDTCHSKGSLVLRDYVPLNQS